MAVLAFSVHQLSSPALSLWQSLGMLNALQLGWCFCELIFILFKVQHIFSPIFFVFSHSFFSLFLFPSIFFFFQNIVVVVTALLLCCCCPYRRWTVIVTSALLLFLIHAIVCVCECFCYRVRRLVSFCHSFRNFRHRRRRCVSAATVILIVVGYSFTFVIFHLSRELKNNGKYTNAARSGLFKSFNNK